MMANGKTDVCCNVQTAVGAENKPIVEFEVTNNASDGNQITPMAAKTKGTLEVDTLTPSWMPGTTASRISSPRRTWAWTFT